MSPRLEHHRDFSSVSGIDVVSASYSDLNPRLTDTNEVLTAPTELSYAMPHKNTRSGR